MGEQEAASYLHSPNSYAFPVQGYDGNQEQGLLPVGAQGGNTGADWEVRPLSQLGKMPEQPYWGKNLALGCCNRQSCRFRSIHILLEKEKLSSKSALLSQLQWKDLTGAWPL